jgi:hypothetical protein
LLDPEVAVQPWSLVAVDAGPAPGPDEPEPASAPETMPELPLAELPLAEPGLTLLPALPP